MAIKYAPTKRKPRKNTPSLSQRRANPALRAKLPASRLTASQRAERERLKRVAERNADPLYNPVAGLSGQTLYASAKKVTDAQFEPRIGALNRQLQSTTTQGLGLAQRGADYYRQLAGEEQKRVATQKVLGDLLNTQTAQVGEQSQQSFDRANVQEAQRQQQDTALRGEGLGGDTSQVFGEIAAGRGTAAALQQGDANLAAAQGSNWASLSNAMAQARQLRGGEVQGQLLNRVANQQAQLRGQLADVEGTRGDTFAKNLLDMRQQQFENAVTTTGLDLKQADLQAQVEATASQAETAKAKTQLETDKFKADQAFKTAKLKSDAASRRATTAYNNARIDIQRGIDPVTGKPLPKDKKTGKPQSGADALNRWKLDYAKKHGFLPQTGPTKPPTSGPGAKPKDEPADARKARQAVNSLSTTVKQLSNGRSRTRVADILRQRARAAGQRLPDDLLSAALDLGMDGHVSPRNVQMLTDVYGMSVPAAWKRRPRSPRAGLVAAARGPGVAPLTPVPTL